MIRVLALFTLFAVAATSDGTAQEPDGQALYEERCAACHEGGAPKAPHREMIALQTRGTIVKAMSEGVMMDQSAGLTGDEMAAIAAYLSQLEVSASAAEPPRCHATDWYDARKTAGFEGWGLDENNHHYIAPEVAGFDLSDLLDMELKWAFSFPDANRARSQPVIAGGALFVGSHNGSVFALDAESGCMHWRYQANTEVRTAIGHTEIGGTPYLYFGDLIGHAYVIDAVTGTEVWKRKVDDHPSATITATPAYHDGRLYVPVSSLEVTPAADPAYECCTFRGKVVAVDALTGAELWRGFTIDEEPAPYGKTVVGTQILGPSGAPIWAGLLLDRERGLVIAGTGENYSSPPTGTSDAIIAFDMASGEKRWVFQATPNDAWNVACMMEDRSNCPVEDGPDFDFGAGPLKVDAEPVDLVLAGQKSGIVHGINADTGALLWQRKIGRGGIQGGIHFGMAVGDGRLYAPVSDFVDDVERDFPHQPGIAALDPVTGDLLWQTIHEDICDGRLFCSPGISAAVTAFKGGVLAGAMDGMLRAYDGETGEVVWSYDTTVYVETTSGAKARGGSMGGAAAPVAYNGYLYVNSGYGIYNHMPGNVLLVFGPKDPAPADR